MSEVIIELDWAAVKLRPKHTGLPMAVWITENEGYSHDVRVKVSTVHGGRGSWNTAPSVGVRPEPHEIVEGSLSATDLALVKDWVALNHTVIIDFWDGRIDFDEVSARLRRLT